MLVQAQSDRTLDEMVSDIIGYRIDGVVTALSILSQQAADAITAHGIPVVTLNSGVTTETIRVVGIDNVGAGREAALHMIARGGSHFAYVGADSIASRAREEGYCAAVTKAGFARPQCLSGTLDYDGGLAVGRRLLNQSERPNAIFCVNDLTAIGIMDAWRMDGGLNFPADAQIIGFDDIPASRWLTNNLTTINQNVEMMAHHAVEIIENLDTYPHLSTRVDFTMIARGSTGKPVS